MYCLYDWRTQARPVWQTSMKAELHQTFINYHYCLPIACPQAIAEQSHVTLQFHSHSDNVQNANPVNSGGAKPHFPSHETINHNPAAPNLRFLSLQAFDSCILGRAIPVRRITSTSPWPPLAWQVGQSLLGEG